MDEDVDLQEIWVSSRVEVARQLAVLRGNAEFGVRKTLEGLQFQPPSQRAVAHEDGTLTIFVSIPSIRYNVSIDARADEWGPRQD